MKDCKYTKEINKTLSYEKEYNKFKESYLLKLRFYHFLMLAILNITLSLLILKQLDLINDLETALTTSIKLIDFKYIFSKEETYIYFNNIIFYIKFSLVSTLCLNIIFFFKLKTAEKFRLRNGNEEKNLSKIIKEQKDLSITVLIIMSINFFINNFISNELKYYLSLHNAIIIIGISVYMLDSQISNFKKIMIGTSIKEIKHNIGKIVIDMAKTEEKININFKKEIKETKNKYLYKSIENYYRNINLEKENCFILNRLEKTQNRFNNKMSRYNEINLKINNNFK